MNEFYNYFKEVYGKDGIYPLLKYSIVCDSDGIDRDIDLKMLYDEAVKIRLKKVNNPFDMDSLDRELIRDIIILNNKERVHIDEIEHKHLLKDLIN